jgi:hypothetical protein
LTRLTSDVQPAFTVSIYHINPAAPLAVGDHVAEGQ